MGTAEGSLSSAPPASGAPTSREPAVVLEAVHAAPCIAALSLRIAAGERVALIGANGVGKTTLLRLIAGLVRASGGDIHASGSIGHAPQDYRASFLPWLSAERNLLLALEASELSRDDARVRVDAILTSLSVDRACLAKYAHRLSGGQQQLLAVARALVGQPTLLLLDEPFSALDGPRRARARAAVVAAAEETHATVVLVSHDLEDVVAVAQRVVALEGRPARITAELTVASTAPSVLAELLTRSSEDA